MRFVILGGYGNMGSIAARDLFDANKKAEIIIAGRDLSKAKKFADSFKNKRVSYAQIDINDEKKLVSLLKNSAVCVNCVQYYYNVQIMKACLKAGTNYLDLGGLYHVTLKQLKLKKEFEKIGKIAVLGCGSTPGITNILAAYAYEKLRNVKEMHISFGDHDKTKYNQPFVLPYSMQTLIDEFSEKPAVLKNGKIIFAKPGDGGKEITFPQPVGKLQGFYSLHSELATFKESFGIKECTFRITFAKTFNEQVRFLIDAGFASEKEVTIGTAKIKPKDFTSKIMDQWLPKNVKVNDLEYLRVEVQGNKKIIMDCLSTTNTKYNSPAGTYNTAVAPSIIAQMIADGTVSGGGVFPPEKVVPPRKFFDELAKRKIYVFENGKKIN